MENKNPNNVTEVQNLSHMDLINLMYDVLEDNVQEGGQGNQHLLLEVPVELSRGTLLAQQRPVSVA